MGITCKFPRSEWDGKGAVCMPPFCMCNLLALWTVPKNRACMSAHTATGYGLINDSGKALSWQRATFWHQSIYFGKFGTCRFSWPSCWEEKRHTTRKEALKPARYGREVSAISCTAASPVMEIAGHLVRRKRKKTLLRLLLYPQLDQCCEREKNRSKDSTNFGAFAAAILL